SASAAAAAASAGATIRSIAWPSRRPRSAASAARPSRPAPQTATRRPRSASIRIEQRPQRFRNAVLARRRQPALEVELGGVEGRLDLAPEARNQRVFAPLRPSRERGHGSARLAALAHALERLLRVP